MGESEKQAGHEKSSGRKEFTLAEFARILIVPGRNQHAVTGPAGNNFLPGPENSGFTCQNSLALTMIDGLTITEAAGRLDRSEAVIYAARSRIMRRLKDTEKELEQEI